jgi:GH15 family glucan-1,4-alpha-glucosidase
METMKWREREAFESDVLTTGLRVYVIGHKNGRFEGRWNGIWNLPLKIADAVNFGISRDEGVPIDWLPDFCKEFAFGGDVERTFEIGELSIDQHVFVPKFKRGVCWIFEIKNRGDTKVAFNFIANPVTNLEWELKQTGDVWKEKKYLGTYDARRRMILVRHHKRPNWMMLFGSDREPAHVCCDVADINKCKDRGFPGPMDHCVGSSIMSYRIEIDAGDTVEIRFVLAGGDATYHRLIEEYEEMIGSTRKLLGVTIDAYTDYLQTVLRFESGIRDVDDAFVRSSIGMLLLKHYQHGYGLGFMAGLPHFPIYFGRDIAWTVFGSNCIGDFQTSQSALALLARFQAKTDGDDAVRVPFYRGEIPHEVRMDGSIYYYSVDATPLFVIALHDYYKWSGDKNFVRYLYDNMLRALGWCMEADRDSDGLIEHGPEGFLIDTQWMDSHFRGKSGVDVQAIFGHAFKCGAEIASEFGDDDLAEACMGRYNELKSLIIERYWDEAYGFLYDTIQPDGTLKKDMTVNAVIPVFFDIIEPDKAESILKWMESDEFTTSWGVRTRARSDPEYDGKSYQKGGVWPFVTGWVAYSEFSHGNFKEGFLKTYQMTEMQRFSKLYFKEVLSGDVPPEPSGEEDPAGCFIQAWSATIYLHTVVRGLLGIVPHAPESVTICPYLTSDWDISVKRLAVGESLLYFEMKLDGADVVASIRNEGNIIDVDFGVVVQVIADRWSATINGVRVDAATEIIKGKYTKVMVRFPLEKEDILDKRGIKNIVFGIGGDK